MATHRPPRGGLASAMLGLSLLALLAPRPAAAYEPGKAPFSVRVGEELVPYRVFAVYALPGEEVALSVHHPGKAPYELTAGGGTVRRTAAAAWRWRAPAAPGLQRLTVAGPAGSITLNAFVMVPQSQVRDGALNGYRIGAYPATALRGLAIYRPPRGFVEVTPANADTPLSPHFTLRQFLCKQAGDWPRYVVLRPRLLLKLEQLLERVNQVGIPAESFFVMSGYRTPAYNTAIGNVRYSRHQWGGAADIFIDEHPRDGVMDDLNGDGAIDLRDADLLYELFDAEAHNEDTLVGGLGIYGNTSNHGPFVHVDARGFRARWGRRPAPVVAATAGGG